MPESPIDVYLQSIERELHVHLGRREALQALAEVEAHLYERSEALVELGSAPQNAQLEAILGFGMPWEIASQYAAIPVKRRAPDWLGDALVAVGVAGSSLALQFGSYPAVYCLGCLIYLGAVFNRRFPWVGLGLALWFSWWYVMSGPEEMIYRGRLESNLQVGFVSVLGSYIFGQALRWLLRQMSLSIRRRISAR